MAETVVEELARKRLGRTIKGKWRLDRLIGVGGMAAVYAATHRNGARVALKMLHPTISASQQIRARFVREGYLANKVDHPGVVRVLDDDVDDADQSAFLVMDLVVGTTLAERAMDRLLDAGEVLDVAEQVLSVLQAAHEKGIIHRDLKPDNLLVDRAGKVHVLDFGIARLLDDTGVASATKTGTAFGTPGFMAPEQALGKTNLISARSDIYALGATLFALVCGDFVHAAENPQELLVLVATQPARSLGELAPQTAPEVVSIIDRATRNAAEDRWASAAEMLAAVQAAKAKLGVHGVRVLPLGPGNETPPPQPVAPSLAEPAPEIAAPAPMDPPLRRASNPDAMTMASLSPIEPVSAVKPFEIASEIVQAPVRKPKLLPLVVLGGGAVLIGILAIVATTTGRGAAAKSGEATTEPAPTALAAKPDEATTGTAPAQAEPTETAPTGTATETAPADAAKAATSNHAPSASAAAPKPTGKLPPKPTGSPAGAKSGKVDLGY